MREILSPGHYQDVVVLVADMCSFSSFVRDTPKGNVIRENLTSFYSKARYQILNNGGVHYQFVGDEVIGIFGLPDHTPGYIEAAYETARALGSIGRSVAHEWQRQIDREQSPVGLKMGLAVGDLHLLALRPFSRTHIGFTGDCINMAARLMSHATWRRDHRKQRLLPAAPFHRSRRILRAGIRRGEERRADQSLEGRGAVMPKLRSCARRE